MRLLLRRASGINICGGVSALIVRWYPPWAQAIYQVLVYTWLPRTNVIVGLTKARVYVCMTCALVPATFHWYPNTNNTVYRSIGWDQKSKKRERESKMRVSDCFCCQKERLGTSRYNRFNLSYRRLCLTSDN